MPRAEIAARVDAILATTHLTELAERKPEQLSGGQKQRVALARALVKRPRAAPARRAARRARQEAPRRHAARAEAPAARGRHHLRRRHPRPGGGAGHGRPHGGAEGRPAPPVRHAARDLRAPGRPLRRRLHRRDEFLRGAHLRADGVEVAGGRSIAGRLPDGASLGAAATAAVRPERIRLFPTTESPTARPARSRRSSITASTCSSASLTGLSQKPLLVRLTAEDADRRKVAAGDTVEIGWAPADTRIFVD